MCPLQVIRFLVTYDIDFWPWEKTAYNSRNVGHIFMQFFYGNVPYLNKHGHVWPLTLKVILFRLSFVAENWWHCAVCVLLRHWGLIVLKDPLRSSILYPLSLSTCLGIIMKCQEYGVSSPKWKVWPVVLWMCTGLEHTDEKAKVWSWLTERYLQNIH